MPNDNFFKKVWRYVILLMVNLIVITFVNYGLLFLYADGNVEIIDTFNKDYLLLRSITFIAIALFTTFITTYLFIQNKNEKDLTILVTVFVLYCFLTPGILFTTFNNKLVPTGQYGQQKKADRHVQTIYVKACADEDKTRCIDNALLLAGQITPTSANRLKQAIRDTKAATVCLDSMGGDNNAAIDIIRFIKKNKLTTCIASHYFVNDKELKRNAQNTPHTFPLLTNLVEQYPSCADCIVLYNLALNREPNKHRLAS